MFGTLVKGADGWLLWGWGSDWIRGCGIHATVWRLCLRQAPLLAVAEGETREAVFDATYAASPLPLKSINDSPTCSTACSRQNALALPDKASAYVLYRHMPYTGLCIIQAYTLHGPMPYMGLCLAQAYALHRPMPYAGLCLIHAYALYMPMPYTGLYVITVST